MDVERSRNHALYIYTDCFHWFDLPPFLSNRLSTVRFTDPVSLASRMIVDYGFSPSPNVGIPKNLSAISQRALLDNSTPRRIPPPPSWRIVPLVASHSFDNFLHLTLRDFSLFFGTPFLVLCTIYNFLHFSQRFYSNRVERKGLDRDVIWLIPEQEREKKSYFLCFLLFADYYGDRRKEGK